MEDLIRVGFVDVPGGILALADAENVWPPQKYARSVLFEKAQWDEATGYPAHRVDLEGQAPPHPPIEGLAFWLPSRGRYRVDAEVERPSLRVLRFVLTCVEDP